MQVPASEAQPGHQPGSAQKKRVMQSNGPDGSQQLRLAAKSQQVGAVESAQLPLKGGAPQLAPHVLAASLADAGQHKHDAMKPGPSQRPGSISGTTRQPQQEAEQPAGMEAMPRADTAARGRQAEGCRGRTGEPACSPGTAAQGRQIAGSRGRLRGVSARSKSRAAKCRHPAGDGARSRQLQADLPLGGLSDSSARQMPLLAAVKAVTHAAGDNPVLTSQDRPEQVAEAAPPAAERRPSQLRVSLCDRGQEVATVSLRWDPARTVKSLHGEGTGQLGLALHPVATGLQPCPDRGPGALWTPALTLQAPYSQRWPSCTGEQTRTV